MMIFTYVSTEQLDEKIENLRQSTDALGTQIKSFPKKTSNQNIKLLRYRQKEILSDLKLLQKTVSKIIPFHLQNDFDMNHLINNLFDIIDDAINTAHFLIEAISSQQYRKSRKKDNKDHYDNNDNNGPSLNRLSA